MGLRDSDGGVILVIAPLNINRKRSWVSSTGPCGKRKRRRRNYFYLNNSSLKEMDMNKIRLTINMLIAFVACLLCTTLAQAQATRTWVSGVGDDVNPCSRTAPCKTFAGAISKTAAGGEISVLDPGGFGAVTITKSITISGDGTLAGILAATVNGVIVNAGVNDKVVLRNISINGVGNGLDGIRFLAGKMLLVDNCNISGFTQEGIDVVHTSTTTPGQLIVQNTSVTNIGLSAIRVDNAAGAVAPSATLNNVKINLANIGFDVLKAATATITDSVISNVTGQAIVAENTAVINAVGCTLFKNGTGISAFTSGSTIRFANCEIFNNTVGVNVAAGATGDRFGNSRLFGNGTDTVGTTTLRTNQ
jgi:parallel beta helix pectate lyase-like protein